LTVTVVYSECMGNAESVARPADAESGDVARARGGDAQAFEALVRRREAEVHRLCVRMLGDREEALEATQDVFLRVFRGLPRFRGEASFRTWVIGIAINVCRSRLGSRKWRERRAAASLQREDPEGGERDELLVRDPAPSPEERAYGRQLGVALNSALAQLHPEHREILLLREMEQLEYEELASVIGCAVGTVKSRLARARSALRRALEGIWP